MLVYESMRAVSATTSDSDFVVYANRFDADGTQKWNNQDVRCATNDESQWYPRVVVLGRRHGAGDSAVVIVWQDVREDPGHSISYLARVICVWEDLRDEGTTGVDIDGAVMNGITEGILTPGGTDGDEVCVRSEDQRYPKVDNYLDDPEAYIVWLHDPSSGYSDIWYNDVSLTTLQWTWTQGVGLEVTGAKNDQFSPQVGGDVFVYADYRRQPITYDNTSDWNIYAETPGECVGDKYMDWRDMFAEVTTTGDAEHMRFVLGDEYNTFVVWEEAGSGHGEQNVYIQKLDVDGVPRWENSGIRLNTSVYASHPVS
ncbi:MAG: hypothetical protein JXA28_11335, partial [Bacteroidetes bacterium]|nr:hypothetical protein [Bacteroidota bacterium]